MSIAKQPAVSKDPEVSILFQDGLWLTTIGDREREGGKN
jgi:hypothetical protein